MTMTKHYKLMARGPSEKADNLFEFIVNAIHATESIDKRSWTADPFASFTPEELALDTRAEEKARAAAEKHTRDLQRMAFVPGERSVAERRASWRS